MVYTIAIDGPAASGKSSAAEIVAKKLKLTSKYIHSKSGFNLVLVGLCNVTNVLLMNRKRFNSASGA